MQDSEPEPSIELVVTECEYELVSALREIRDPEVGQMVSELIHVLSISHVADVIPIARKNPGLIVTGGTEAPRAPLAKDAVPIDLDLVDA